MEPPCKTCYSRALSLSLSRARAQTPPRFEDAREKSVNEFIRSFSRFSAL